MPFPEEMAAALVSHAGPKGELLETALRYERGDFVPPADELGDAYLEAIEWATSAADELFNEAPAVAA
jgi:hypothetical protein